MPDTPENEVVERLAKAAAGVNATPVATGDADVLQLVRERTYDPAGGMTVETVRVIDLQAYAERPERRSGSVRFDEPESFERYVNEFKREEETRLYANLKGAQIVAVVNDDRALDGTGGNGSWRDHRATLQMQPTPEWMEWVARDKMLTGQVEFAEFLEEHLGQITEPSAADMIEIARTFTASTETAFRSAINLTSGETQLRYEEAIDSHAGVAGQLTIPTELGLTMMIYQGSEAVDITARLRYRLKDGNLRIGYLLNDALRMEREAFQAEVNALGSSTGLEPFFGVPANPPGARG